MSDEKYQENQQEERDIFSFIPNARKRFFAVIIDMLLGMPAIALGTHGYDSGQPILVFVSIIIGIVIYVYSWVWLAYRNDGQDIAKKLLNLRIANNRSSVKLSLGQLFLRAIFRPIGFCFAFGSAFLGWFFTLLWRKIDWYRSCILKFFGLFIKPWHDYLAGTTVIESTSESRFNFKSYHWL